MSENPSPVVTQVVTIEMPPPVARVELPLPDRKLSPNANRGSSRRAFLYRNILVQQYREMAAWKWKQAMLNRGAPRLKEAVAWACFHWPDKRRRDADNALASLKAAWDGAQDSGILQDDWRLQHLPPTMGLDRGDPRVVLFLFACRVEVGTGSKREEN